MTSSSATLSYSSFSSTSALSSSKFRFKFPSFSRTSSLSSRAKPFTTSSSTTTHNFSGEIRHCSLSRRRGLAFTATLPFLLPLHEFVDSVAAKAVESGLGQSEYLRIKEEIIKVVTKGKAAGVLRLVFHDAGTYEMDENSGGMNGSIVYELERPENVGLKKSLKALSMYLYVLEKAKKEIEAIQSGFFFLSAILDEKDFDGNEWYIVTLRCGFSFPLLVSWADMIAVGGAEAVSICGGPKIPVTLGRLDSGEPDPEGKMPEESLDASGLKQCFRRKGFS
ncbi:hypothetical protein Goarm_004911 [Gossypium armourianum]|uniref:Plant heme peroxidase family profile domain-containing protein n=1 Tax=Gossypium armourianum TaxID=34283 RepID=A0A7J9JY93_9ROSI|nr:hypothetical protein [Gossypium armourianum]